MCRTGLSLYLIPLNSSLIFLRYWTSWDIGKWKSLRMVWGFFQHTLVLVEGLKKSGALPQTVHHCWASSSFTPWNIHSSDTRTCRLPAKAIMEICFHACRLHSLGDLLVYYPHIKTKTLWIRQQNINSILTSSFLTIIVQQTEMPLKYLYMAFIFTTSGSKEF